MPYINNNYESTFLYAMEITELKVKDEIVNDVINNQSVVQVYWKLTGTDPAGNYGVFIGATPLTSTTMSDISAFIPFNKLTENDIKQWIFNVILNDSSYQEHIDEMIQEQIDAKLTPTVKVALPWE